MEYRLYNIIRTGIMPSKAFFQKSAQFKHSRVSSCLDIVEAEVKVW